MPLLFVLSRSVFSIENQLNIRWLLVRSVYVANITIIDWKFGKFHFVRFLRKKRLWADLEKLIQWNAKLIPMLIWLLIQSEWVRKYDGNPFAETQINNHWNLVTEMPSQGNFTFQCFEQNSERNRSYANTCNKWYQRGKNAQKRSNIRWNYDIQIIMIGWFLVFHQVGVGMILLLRHICYWITTIII